MPKITHRKKRLSSFKLIVLGFAGVIVLGALILMLPFSSTAGVVTPFHGRCSHRPPPFALRGWSCRIRAVIGPLSGRR